MASLEQFLDDYEISRLVSDSDDSEDDRHSGDDIGLSGSEDEENAVEEDLNDDIDSLYDVADAGDLGQRKTQTLSIQKQEKAQTRRRMFFMAKILPGAGHLTKLLELAERT